MSNDRINNDSHPEDDDVTTRSETFTIDTATDERLDVFLQKVYPPASRGAIQRLILDGHITLNGQQTKPSYHPRQGEVVHVYWPPPKPAEAQPEDIPLDIIFEDADIVVVNKQPGLVVHPSAGHDEHTLVNALLHHCAGQLSGVGGVARPGIVHRIDKETSGCLIAAKNDAAHLALAEQFSERRTHKTYHAIACGRPLHDEGCIHAAIARHPSHRKQMAISYGTGREAITHFKLLRPLKGASLLEAHIHTGRTHQIRVHFKHIGAPLVGDTTYGKKANQRFESTTGFSAGRVMLHSTRLAISHPRSGARMAFEAPWPDDFKNAVDFLSLQS
ncbi:MAG: RluA family pseudouridine synthase [Verrucomicrobia bacterium]|nr:RluA family pseudouridine synthase [Verrucomicrobiota bacterium]